MNEDELVHELVNSLAFEVEAIPTDNVIKFTSTNGTPLNVKVRVRNKDEPRLVQRGIVSVPKLGKHIASVDKIRLISSDQTILSFNVYMETELEKQSPPKNRKHGFNFFKFGGCLGTSYDEDEGPYLPGPSSKKALRSRTSSKSDSDIHDENTDVADKLKLNLETSNTVSRNQKKLFGKCKPGGCLDPPFGEDKEPYSLPNAQAHNIKQKQTVSEVEDNKKGQSIRTSSVEPGKSSKAPTKLNRKEPNKDVIEPKPLLDIYARPVSLENSSTSNYSNATITHHSRMSSSKMIDAGKNNSTTYNDESLRQSYQYPETYFIPPKGILQHKEEERRYSRERSNDQIRPATTRRENDHQTSNMSHVFDVPNKNHPENADTRSPQTMKLSKHKGNDNTERIKQTLTDMTSSEMDNGPKISEDYRKPSKTPLNMQLITQKVDISSGYKETPSHDVTYLKNIDDFDIPITSADLDFTDISKSDPREAKNKEQHQNITLTKNKEAIEMNLREKSITDNLYEPENKYLSKDMRTKNINKNEEPTKLETINIAKLESGKIEDVYISPILVSGQGEAKILQSDTHKSPQDDYLSSGLYITSDDKPTNTSDKIQKATASQLPSNLAKDQTKLSMAVRLSSLEKVLDVEDTNEKNKSTPEAHLKDNRESERRDTNVYPDTEKNAESIQKLQMRKLSQKQTNNSQDLNDSKQTNANPNLLVSGMDDEKVRKSLRTQLRSGEIPENHIKGSNNVQEEQMQGSQINNKLEADRLQKPFNDFVVDEGSERKKIQDLDLKTIHNEKLNNLPVVEIHGKTLGDKLDLNSRDTPDNDVKFKNGQQSNTDLITNHKVLQSTAPSETIHKQVFDKEYREPKRNDNVDFVPNNKEKDGVAELYLHDPIKGNKHIENIPDFSGVSLNKVEDCSTVKNRKPGDMTKATSKDLEKKQVQDNKYAKNSISDNQTTNFENAFGLNDKKLPLTSKTVDSRHLKNQPIDTSITNIKVHPVQNSSHDSILNADKQLTTSSTNSIDSSNNVKTNNLNYEENKKALGNVNLTDNDNVIIQNISLHDKNKNLIRNSQDRIPSAILQKTQLIRTDNSDLRNDDINVIKPFKRNTFTIVASSSSLEKQDEPISTQETNNLTDERFEAKRERKLAPNDQTTTDSEHFAQKYQKKENDLIADSKQETITTDAFLNISPNSNTNYEQTRETSSERENKIKVPGLPENQKTSKIEVASNTRYDDKVRTNNYEKSSLASDKASNDINKVETETLKRQNQTDNNMYNKEKKLFMNIPSDFAKQITELQDRSDNEFEKIQLEPKLRIAPHNNEKIENDVINNKFNDTTADNKTIQITNSQLRDNTDDLSNNKISISNISVAEGVLTTGLTKGTEDIAVGETEAIISDEKSDTNSARNAMEYGSTLLEMSESKVDHELVEQKYTAIDIYKSTVAGEPDENTLKLFSIEKSGKVDDGNAELDTQPIYTKDLSAIMVDETENVRLKTDLVTLGSFNKLIDENSLVPENDTGIENDTGTDNLRKILGSGAIGSFSKIIDSNSLVAKDDSRYYSEFDGGAKINAEGDTKHKLESDSDRSFNKVIDKTPLMANDGTRYYSEYNSPTEMNENGGLRKVSEEDSVGNFKEVFNKKHLLANYSITHDVDHHSVSRNYEDGTLRKLSNADTVGSFDKDIDKKPAAPKYGTSHYSEYVLSSKAPNIVDDLSNIDQEGAKIHLNAKQFTDQSDSIVLKQQLTVKERVYNQNETILSPTDKINSEVLFLNLALQSYVNDNNETVVKNVSPLVEPVRYKDDNITVVQSLIRHGQEIRIPVDVENDLSLKFMRKNHEMPQDAHTDQNSSKKAQITRNISEHAHHHPEDVNNSLAFIYEKDLIPLHFIIKNLTEEINTLTTQQELLKDKMRGVKRTKSLRLIPVHKRCGCGRM